MNVFTADDSEKTVFVHGYDRCRNGQWEAVKSHYRRPPNRKKKLPRGLLSHKLAA
jgi:hypothetical protein